VLRDALKRCSPATYYAACKFKRFGRSEDLRTIVLGVIERFVERELRPKLTDASETLRLREDLGLDSLTMMEVVMVAEDVVSVSVSNDELTQLRTLGDVHAFLLAKTTPFTSLSHVAKSNAHLRSWEIAKLSGDMRRIDTTAPVRPVTPVSNKA
jgi:acyl carrier protein